MTTFKLITISIISFLGLACSKSDDNTQDNVKNTLIGKWNIVSRTDAGENALRDDCEKKSYITFTENEYIDSFFTTKNGECVKEEDKLTYTISEDKIIVSNSYESVSYSFTIVGNQLTFTRKTINNNGIEEAFIEIYVKE
ncbi:MAG: lipocalin family protein [Capnocytophaga sp.]|nr:lipocalin family protein [Capnocytophaga sp.]